ncbi:Predicted 5' DNA nuclease, flap endonuclease-1-like, helix-3-turn-helix (H3TH) domain [Marinobacter antarcticus]|uniref:Predicted 5' DNA nuclease, flap endonuclease-1-like, helix-3-turn-helix (H3TH) domain n=1 Tax=Marinobacter antarcticus TaxID=564117 RepID=A0A1M6UGE8_9GAMM|nr:helix-hairpin-helix domain-containing protein [Marinobacter antarcticus]SHK68138.1 Predicted 5' DNA nuclease, flap endonuclease-1-like, helix-3-turn-helix (H3TH) domain [Marinobacter antarcticus]
MAKKAKESVDKIVKKVNKEFEKTSSQIEGLVSDARKQLDSLQHQVQDPVRKVLKEVDELREREMKRFSDEFERRLDEFHELQSNILERLGVASKEDIRKAEKESKKELKKAPASAASTAAKKPAAKKPAAKKPAVKKAAPKKPAAKKAPTATAKKPVDKSNLTLVKGIGPATAQKLKAAGITSIDQIANPSAADQEKLNGFSHIKGFDQFTVEAKKIN